MTDPADIKRLLDAATPGPWEPVPEEGRHGPYVTSDFGSTIADCYYMRQKHAFSTETVPSNYMAEMAPANAALIALAPELDHREDHRGLDRGVHGAREVTRAILISLPISAAIWWWLWRVMCLPGL